MYRNCPEHPIIKEVLISGEPFSAGGTKQATWAKEAVVTEVFELTEPEFADICLKRKKAAAHQEGNCK